MIPPGYTLVHECVLPASAEVLTDEDLGCEYCRNDGALNDLAICPRCDAQYDDADIAPAPDAGTKVAGEAFGRPIEGFGASYHRDDDLWVLYTMPDTVRFGTVEGYGRKHMDWVVDTLRAALAATPIPPASDPQAGELIEAVRAVLPIGNPNLPDEKVIPLYLTMGELRRLRALIARTKGEGK